MTESSEAVARIILNVLGFSSVHEFALAAGVSDATATALIYRRKRQYKNYFSMFAKAFDTLRHKYKDIEFTLERENKRFLRNWIKGWAEDCVKNYVTFERLTQRVAKGQHKQPAEFKRRYRRIDVNREKMRLLIQTF